MIENMFDIHCHFLPGVDDGSDSMQTTIGLLEADARDGVTDIIVTPHFRRRMFEPPMSLIWKQFDRVQEKANEIGMRLYRGCEYHANMDMVEQLKAGARPTMAGSRYVLTEFKESSPEDFIRERTNSLLSAGYVPIIAHLERYKAMRGKFEFIEELAERGCRMQMNADSIAGRDGFFMSRFAKKMAEYDLIDFVGSDGHDLGRRAPHMGECAEKLVKWGGEDYARHVLCENPRMILEDR